jgi:hypothetical protein
MDRLVKGGHIPHITQILFRKYMSKTQLSNLEDLQFGVKYQSAVGRPSYEFDNFMVKDLGIWSSALRNNMTEHDISDTDFTDLPDWEQWNKRSYIWDGLIVFFCYGPLLFLFLGYSLFVWWH